LKNPFVKVQMLFTFDFSTQNVCFLTKQLNYAENVDTSNKNTKKAWNEFCVFLEDKKYFTVLAGNLAIGNFDKRKTSVTSVRSLQHSMANFYRELPQLRCTELQLKMRFAGLHLQLKRVAHEQNTRLAVSSRAQRGSVADK
jgi:hypothetical protein